MQLGLGQHAFRLFPRERPAIAKNIAKLGQARVHHFRQQLLHQQLDVAFGAVPQAAKLRRNRVGPQECRNDFQRLLRIQVPVQPKDLQFARDIQSIPAFRFQRCRAVGRKFLQCRSCSVF